MYPKTICNPPNPAAIRRFPHPAGENNAAAPSPMKQSPITGTTPTENAPPVTTPAPYNNNQTPGSTSSACARHNASDKTAPAANGGVKLKVNFLPGADSNFRRDTSAFRFMLHPPINNANGSSHAHGYIHSCSSRICAATNAAANAVTPIATPPHPGTAVNDDARSIVSRINARLSIARPCNVDGSAGSFPSTSGRIRSIELITLES